MQAMGWSNPQQFMVPPSALQQKPPPEVQYAQAMVGDPTASSRQSDTYFRLEERFGLDQLQAQAILDMRLQKLAGLERKKIEDDLKAVQALIAELKAILASEKKMLGIIKDELNAIKEKYGDDRKTKIMNGGTNMISDEDLIPEKETVLVFTAGGYVKRTDPSEYKMQRRGGVGVIDLETKEEDFVTQLLTTDTHSDLLFFTNKGKAYQIKMYELPEGRRATKGKSIMNYLSLAGDEKVTDRKSVV